MEFLQSLLPGAGVLRLERYEMEDGDHLTLRLSSTQTIVPCPLCGGMTQRIHSHYERTLADLPCIHFRLRLILQVCKFFCLNTECCRRIFTERLPEVAAPWARKTVRFIERLQSIGLALGGAASARLGDRLGYASSGSTVLNHLHCLPLPTFKTPKALGVDDFAFRKGHNYGTILVDLETHQPIALLADRKAETLIEWLQAHPGIEVLSRDRSKTYKSAMDKAAPTAMQVADRFHLVKNLSEVLERVLGDYRSELKKVEHSQQQATIAALPEKAVVARPNPTATEQAQQRILSNQKHRIKQQKAIKKMQAQQCRPSVIARTLGVSRHTVARYGAAPDFPTAPARRPTFGRSLLAPYKQQLLGWWNDGIRQPSILMERLQAVGYTGTIRTLQRYISGVRHAQGLPPVRVRVDKPLPKVMMAESPPFTPKQAAYLLVLRPENRQAEETDLLERMTQQHPNLAMLVDLANEFLQLLRQRQSNGFDDWLDRIEKSSIKPLQTFAKGLMDDYAAVKASMSSEWSNGPVEGLNNKLKMLKRQMYGRASLGLLAKRFIMPVSSG